MNKQYPIKRRNSLWNNERKLCTIDMDSLTIEELMNMYNHIKSNLKNLKWDDVTIDGNLETIINALIYKNIEIAKALIIDLINANCKYIDLHEIVKISTIRFAYEEETNTIFSNTKIFNWFFGEYKNSYAYKLHISKNPDIALRSIKESFYFFIRTNQNDKLNYAFSIFLNSISIEEQESFFTEFIKSFNSESLSSQQKEIIVKYIAGLKNEENIKTQLGFYNNDTNKLIARLKELNYNIVDNYKEVAHILKQLQNKDENALVDCLIELLKTNVKNNQDKKKKEYHLHDLFRCSIENKIELLLKYRNLRIEIAKNYMLNYDYLPLGYSRWKIGDNKDQIAYAIKEMIDINIQYGLFDAVDFLDDCRISSCKNKDIVEMIMRIMFNLLYVNNNSKNKYLEIIFYYYIDIEKITQFELDEKYRQKFYNDLNNNFLISVSIINKLLKKENKNTLSETEFQEYLKIHSILFKIIELNSRISPISGFELIRSLNEPNLLEIKKELSYTYFKKLMENIDYFEWVTKYFEYNNLISEIAEIFEVNKITKLTTSSFNDVKAFSNDDYINSITKLISDYLHAIQKLNQPIGIAALSFFQELYKKVVFVNEFDKQFKNYLKENIVCIRYMDNVEIDICKLDETMHQLCGGDE